MHEVAEHPSQVLEQNAGGHFQSPFAVVVGLFQHLQRLAQALAVVGITSAYHPGFHQAAIHAANQGRRAARELPGDFQIGTGNPFDPVEYEILIGFG